MLSDAWYDARDREVESIDATDAGVKRASCVSDEAVDRGRKGSVGSEPGKPDGHKVTDSVVNEGIDGCRDGRRVVDDRAWRRTGFLGKPAGLESLPSCRTAEGKRAEGTKTGDGLREGTVVVERVGRRDLVIEVGYCEVEKEEGDEDSCCGGYREEQVIDVLRPVDNQDEREE